MLCFKEITKNSKKKQKLKYTYSRKVKKRSTIVLELCSHLSEKPCMAFHSRCLWLEKSARSASLSWNDFDWLNISEREEGSSHSVVSELVDLSSATNKSNADI